MRAKHAKGHISLRVALVLLVLTLLSFSVNAGLFARYTVTGASSDSARVAKFSVTLDETFTTPAIVFENMAPGESKSYSFAVESKSETAVRLIIESASTTGNLPLKYSLSNAVIAPNSTNTVELTATWSGADNNLQYLGEIDAVRITIKAEQVD